MGQHRAWRRRGLRAWLAQVKVLGVLALVDAGETDWKLLVISTEDALAKLLHGACVWSALRRVVDVMLHLTPRCVRSDIDDVEVNCPGLVDALREWLRFYKTAAGSSPNKFALGERCMDRVRASVAVAVVAVVAA